MVENIAQYADAFSYIEKIGITGILVAICFIFNRKNAELEKKNAELNELIKINQKEFDKKIDDAQKDISEIKGDVKRIKDRQAMSIMPTYQNEQPPQRKTF